MLKSFFWSRDKIILAYGGLFLILYLLYVGVQYSVMLNDWYKPFYDMMQHPKDHTLTEYWKIFGEFWAIVLPWVLVVDPLTSWCTSVYGFEWRQAITMNYIPRWRKISEKIEGESQRIQEDTQKFASIVESLGLQVVNSIMVLTAFMPVLWMLSSGVDVSPVTALARKGFEYLPNFIISFYDMTEASPLFRIIVSVFFVILFVCGIIYMKFQTQIKMTNIQAGLKAEDSRKSTLVFAVLSLCMPFLFLLLVAYMPPLTKIPGILVWVALLTSVGGMVISWFVGIRLPGLEYNNQVAEAKYRKELVLAEDNKHIYGSLPTIFELFSGLRYNYFRLYLNYTYFNLWKGMYRQCMVIVPYLIIGPGLFTGAITLGLLTQASNAFGEVNGSCSVMISNWTRITELRSIWRRLHEFESAMDICADKESV